MEDKNSKVFYDTYTPVELIDEMNEVKQSLLCDYGINGTLTKPSKLSKPEQQLFDRWALMTETLKDKLRKEYHERNTE